MQTKLNTKLSQKKESKKNEKLCTLKLLQAIQKRTRLEQDHRTCFKTRLKGRRSNNKYSKNYRRN